jgi:hypothetical protein
MKKASRTRLTKVKPMKKLSNFIQPRTAGKDALDSSEDKIRQYLASATDERDTAELGEIELRAVVASRVDFE